MNPFARHGITHLSASSLNLYRNEPALWTLRYLHGARDDAGPAAWRGSAVEAGVDWFCMRPDDKPEECINKMLQRFELDASGEATDDIEKERAALCDFLKVATVAFKPFGQPVARQLKIEHRLDGIEVPVIGYVDYTFADSLLDLKTTWRLPSSPKPDHKIQVALYAKETRKAPSLLYVTPKKSQVFGPETIDVDAAYRDLCRAARAVRTLLEMTDDAKSAAQMFCPNFESFYWSDELKEAAKGVWA